MIRWMKGLEPTDRALVIATMLVCALALPAAWTTQISDGKMNRWANETFGTSFDVSPRKFKEDRL